MGTVKQTLADEGQFVKQGQTLAVLDNQTARNAYDMAKATLDQAEDAYKRMKLLYDAKSITEMQWVDIQTKLQQARSSEKMAKKSLTDCVLRAPFSGYIAQRRVDAGSNVAPGVPCFKLVKIDCVKVKVSIPEKEIAHINKGMRMTFSVSALGDKTFEGTVSEKGLQASVLSHTYEVSLSLSNQNHELIPGMVCDVKEQMTKSKEQIIIPQEAVLTDGNSQYIWLDVSGKAQKQNIKSDNICDDGVIVSEGLKAGDKVIVEGKDEVSEGISISEE